MADLFLRHRQRLGLSRRALAGMADISPTTLDKIEQGKREPGVTVISRLGPILGPKFMEEAMALAREER